MFRSSGVVGCHKSARPIVRFAALRVSRLCKPLVLASARSSRSPDQPSNQPAASSNAPASYDDVLQELEGLAYPEVQRRLREYGLPAVGKKAQLIGRLANAMVEQMSAAGSSEEALQEAEVSQEAEEAAEAFGEDEEEWLEEEGGAAGEEDALDPSKLRAELSGMSTEELTEALVTFDLSTQGSREDLVERLAQYMEEDMRREEEELLQQMADGEATNAPKVLTPEEESFLLERRAADAYEELVTFKRQELYHELKQSTPVGQHVAYTGRDHLAQQLSYIRAGEILQQQLADPNQWQAIDDELSGKAAEDAQAEATEASEASDASAPTGKAQLASTGFNNCGVTLTAANADRQTILGMTMTQIKKLKVEELRVAMAVFDQKDVAGNRYEIMDKLIEIIMKEQLSVPTLQDGTQTVGEAVSGMQLRVLRNQLAARGLETTGSRTVLEQRLQQALEQEQEQFEHQKQAQEAQLRGPPLLLPYRADIRLLPDDPAMTVAILFGAPAGGLEDLQASLDAALCAATGLHTAWPPLATPPQVYAEGAEEGEEGEVEPEVSQEPAPGVTARLLYVAHDLSVLDMPAAMLQGISAGDLLAGTPFLMPHAAAVTVHRGAEGLKAAIAAAGAASASQGPVAAVLSLISTAGMSAKASTQLASALQGLAGPPVLGSGSLPAARANKLTLSRTLRQEGFPVLPTHVLLPSNMQTPEAVEKWSSSLETWVDKQGYHRERQLFMVKPAVGSSGHGVVPCRGLAHACETAQGIMRVYLPEASQEFASQDEEAAFAVLVEPYMGESAMQFTVTIVDGPDGPVALMPTEVEILDVENQIFESEIKHQERQLMQNGFTAEEIAEQVEEMRAAGAVQDAPLMVYHHLKPYPFTSLVKYHHPPRLPRKQVHALRHGAALAYSKMGVTGGARVDGWVALEPGWQDKYDHEDDGTGRLLPDVDPEIRERMKQQDEQEIAAEGLAFSEYFDEEAARANLAKFNPRTRLHAATNNEATVFFTDVNPGLELDPAAPVFLQAAELGISHVTMLRNVINASLRTMASHADTKPVKGERKRAGSVDNKTEAAAAASSVAQLTAAPPIDPLQLSPLYFTRPDEFETLQAVTEWREQQWLLAAENKQDREFELEQAQAAIELFELAGEGADDLPTRADGEYDLDLLPYALAEDWDPQFEDRPADTLTPEGVQPQDSQPSLEELRESFPGLPDDQLMFVRLGTAMDGRAIDTERLKARLDELSAAGLMHLAGDALDECLINPETGVVGEPVVDMTGHESEPGGYRSAEAEMDPVEVQEYVDKELSFANARFKGVRKVWLLVGGTPESTDKALSAARDVALQLAGCVDLQVELFLMAPGTGARNEEEVRGALLARRTEWLASGFPEDSLTEPMDLMNVRNGAPEQVPLFQELVWALPMAQALQQSAASASWAAEAALSRQGIAPHALPPLEQHALRVQGEVQREVAAAGLLGVAGMWGGDPTQLPIAPRCMSLEDLITEAVEVEALVVPMLRGGAGAAVVQLLQDQGALYTGSGPIASMVCVDKLACSELIEELGEESGVISMPSQMLMGLGLVESAVDVPFCNVLLEELRGTLIPGYTTPVEDTDIQAPLPPICVRPTAGADGVGIARLDTGRDLALFGEALGAGVQLLPANTLSAPHRPIPMPRFVPDCFMFEPWVETDTLVLVPNEDPGETPEVREFPVNGWVEVSICFLGNLGTMEPMGISLVSNLDPFMPGVAAPPAYIMSGPEDSTGSDAAGDVGNTPETAAGKKKRAASRRKTTSPSPTDESNPDSQTEDSTTSQQPASDAAKEAATGEQDAQEAEELIAGLAPVPVYLTPAPEAVLSPEVVSVIMDRARQVVDELGAIGLVRLDAFVARETGDLMVIEVDTCPSLAQGSLVYQQALQRPEGALTPPELLRTLFSLGLHADRAQAEGDTDADAQLEEEDEFALDEDQAADLAEFDDGSVIEAGGADMMEDLAAMQGSVPGATPSMVGEGDANELYLSSTGRGGRRGRPAKRSQDADDDFGDFEAGGAQQGAGILGDTDFDFDGQGQPPEDPDLMDNWSLR